MNSGANIHKILRLYAETKVSGKSIDINTPLLDVIKEANKEKDLHKFKKDVWFCCYNTKYENEECVALFFTMTLPGSFSGSSASSEMVMNLIYSIENVFTPIDDFKFERNISDEDKENIGILRIIKKVREENIL
jgi:hypothetical protein